MDESPPERLTTRRAGERAALRGSRVPVGTVTGNLRLQSHSPTGLDWTFLGPRPITGGYWTNRRNASGGQRRSCRILERARSLYLAAAGGGVWKTTDAA
jgi:hypothetical protein